jgi:hypothetical protein
MGIDTLTISKLAHHRSTETTRSHYDYFDAQKAIGRMDRGLQEAQNDQTRRVMQK